MWRVEVTVVCDTVNVKCVLCHFCVLLIVSLQKVSCCHTPASELVDLFPSSSLSLQQRTDLSYIVHGWQLINAWRRVRNPGCAASYFPRWHTLQHRLRWIAHLCPLCGIVAPSSVIWSRLSELSHFSHSSKLSHICTAVLIHNDRVLFTLVSNNLKLGFFSHLINMNSIPRIICHAILRY